MGPVTLSKQNRLFWLGRYAERVYTTIQVLMQDYDSLIDGGLSGQDHSIHRNRFSRKDPEYISDLHVFCSDHCL